MAVEFIKGNETMLQLICGNQEEIIKTLGSEFQKLEATMTEGAGEKHLPVIEKSGNMIHVSVGSVLHPMTEEHSINWVYLETNEGGQLKKLGINGEPKFSFALAQGEEAVAVYAYCNLHGFWETRL